MEGFVGGGEIVVDYPGLRGVNRCQKLDQIVHAEALINNVFARCQLICGLLKNYYTSKRAVSERSAHEDAHYQTNYNSLRHKKITSPCEMITQFPKSSGGS